MGIGAIGNGIGTNDIIRTNSRRVLGEKFNYSLETVNSGSKVNEPLMSFSNPKTGESIEIHRSDVYAEDNPLYVLKGRTAEGDSFERTVHAWIIDPRNCDYSEMMVLNLETGNTSPADKARVDALFDSIVEKGKEDDEAAVTKYLDKADYSTAMKDVLDEYKKAGNWDSYLSMDKWQQSIKDYTSVPVYFNRDIMNNSSTIERNGVKGACSFASVKTAEDIMKEIDDRVKAAEKNGPTLREALANHCPNAKNMLYGMVGSSDVMTFDECVKYLEEQFKIMDEKAKSSLVG
ncbi:MAG: hypothetical protein Q4D29_01285 [Lachnospiraceae bacterium]|nr:hypothetical protein [Lachnospiraceae bacterium]